MIGHENMVKLVKNTGKYLEEKADEIIPQNTALKELNIVISLSVEASIPSVTINTECAPTEILHGVKFSNY